MDYIDRSHVVTQLLSVLFWARSFVGGETHGTYNLQRHEPPGLRDVPKFSFHCPAPWYAQVRIRTRLLPHTFSTVMRMWNFNLASPISD